MVHKRQNMHRHGAREYLLGQVLEKTLRDGRIAAVADSAPADRLEQR